MRVSTPALAVAVGLTVCACSNKTTANADNFGAAISKYLQNDVRECLTLAYVPISVIAKQEPHPSKTFLLLEALRSAGLLKSEKYEQQVLDLFGKPWRKDERLRYTPTNFAKSAYREVDVTVTNIEGSKVVREAQMCWANVAFQKVDKWEGPMKLGDYQEARVTYTYTLAPIADWARRDDIQAVADGLKTQVQDTGPRQGALNLKLTSQSWEVIRR